MQTRDNKKLRLFAAIALIVFSIVQLSGCKNGDASFQMPSPEVKVVTVTEETISIDTELSGRTAPYKIAEVRPQVSGIILERLFTEGGDVIQDMPLYQIDDAIYKAELSNAEALLQKAQANYDVAKIKSDRHEILIQTKAISKQEHDDVMAALKQAQAEVAIAQAQVDTAQIRLDYTKVLSPISGRIGKSSVTAGALVTANQVQALAVVQQLDPIYVDVTQSSVELMNLRREMGVDVVSPASTGDAKITLLFNNGATYEHEGTLQFSDVTVDQTTDSITLRAIFPNPKLELLPGMYVRAVLKTAKREHSILIPQQAVSRLPNGTATVLVVHENGDVEKREVTTLRSVGNRWLIGSGLKAGEKVVTEGFQRIRFMPSASAPKVVIKQETLTEQGQQATEQVDTAVSENI